jgi:hypothetical protein
LRFLIREEAFPALCWVATPGVIISLLIGMPWGYATAAITAVGATWSVRRAFRIRMLVTEDEVTVTNYWKTYVIPWSEVSGVAMSAKFKFPSFWPPPTLAFYRRSGRPVLAQATPSRERETSEFQAAVMALAPPSMRALTPPPDWWADQDQPRRRPSP